MRDPVNNIEHTAATLTLGEVAALRASYSFRSAIQAVASGRVRAVQLRDIQKNGKVDWPNVVRTDLARAPEADEWLRADDILFAFRGARFFAVHIGEMPVRAVAATQFMLLRVRNPDNVLPSFLAWQLNQAPAQRYFAQVAGGTAVRSLRRASIEALRVVVPTIESQRMVVNLAAQARREREALEELILIREQQLSRVVCELLETQLDG